MNEINGEASKMINHFFLFSFKVIYFKRASLSHVIMGRKFTKLTIFTHIHIFRYYHFPVFTTFDLLLQLMNTLNSFILKIKKI